MSATSKNIGEILASSPSLRAVVLALANLDGKVTVTSAKRVIRSMPPELRSGFVIARQTDQAIALADELRQIRVVRAKAAKDRALIAQEFNRDIRDRCDDSAVNALREAVEQLRGADLRSTRERWDFRCSREGGVPRSRAVHVPLYWLGPEGGDSACFIELIYVPHDWRRRVRDVAPRGTLMNLLVLDAERMSGAANGPGTLFRLVVADPSEDRAVLRALYASRASNGVVTLHSPPRRIANAERLGAVYYNERIRTVDTDACANASALQGELFNNLPIIPVPQRRASAPRTAAVACLGACESARSGHQS